MRNSEVVEERRIPEGQVVFQLSLLDDPLVPITQRYALQPRDYQLRGIEKAFELWAGGSIGVIFRQPTGSGKTVSGTLIADLWLQQGDDYHVMVLAHERQLVTQFADEIEDILKLRPAIEMGQEYRVAGQYLRNGATNRPVGFTSSTTS
jgi:superfamily II DNA or RNA helicase